MKSSAPANRYVTLAIMHSSRKMGELQITWVWLLLNSCQGAATTKWLKFILLNWFTLKMMSRLLTESSICSSLPAVQDQVLVVFTVFWPITSPLISEPISFLCDYLSHPNDFPLCLTVPPPWEYLVSALPSLPLCDSSVVCFYRITYLSGWRFRYHCLLNWHHYSFLKSVWGFLCVMLETPQSLLKTTCEEIIVVILMYVCL